MILRPIENQKRLYSIAAYSLFAGLIVSLISFSTAVAGQSLASPQYASYAETDNPEQLIQSLREELGPYSDALAETLRQYGRSHQENGDHELALEFLKDAWQISKINHGLYSADQVANLELIIYSEMELQRWDAVDDHFAYLELLHRRVYASNDPELELGLQKVSAWHVHALSIRDSSKHVEHLRKAYHLFKDRLQMAEGNLAADDPKFHYLKESIQITEQRLRLLAQRDNGVIWQPSIAGSSLLADSY